MEEFEEVLSTGKVYTERSVFIATALGRLLVAGYLIAENFKTLGERRRIKMVWLNAVIISMLVFGGLFLVPDVDKVPRFIIPLALGALASVVVKNYQGVRITEHINAGGAVYKMGRAIWVSLIGALVTLLIVFCIVFLTGLE